jgi:uncharacterized protein (DUF924 family)
MADLSIPPLASSVLKFWFDEQPFTPQRASEKASLWWSGSKNTDFDIERRFGKLVSLAGSGALDDWQDKPQSAVALILLLDQFPRNIHRGSAEAFALDRKALLCSYRLIERAEFMQLNPLYRSFSLLPLEHSESLADQDACVEQFQILIQESETEWGEVLRGYLDFAEQHRKIIRDFGRFPHRNAVLERASTPEEIAYLNGGAKHFGQ